MTDLVIVGAGAAAHVQVVAVGHGVGRLLTLIIIGGGLHAQALVLGHGRGLRRRLGGGLGFGGRLLGRGALCGKVVGGGIVNALYGGTAADGIAGGRLAAAGFAVKGAAQQQDTENDAGDERYSAEHQTGHCFFTDFTHDSRPLSG